MSPFGRRCILGYKGSQRSASFNVVHSLLGENTSILLRKTHGNPFVKPAITTTLPSGTMIHVGYHLVEPIFGILCQFNDNGSKRYDCSSPRNGGIGIPNRELSYL